jgi:secreted PhoX family phosphatase
MSPIDRRSFLARGAAAAGAAAVSGSLLQTFNLAGASPAPARGGHGHRAGYGPVSRTPDQNGDFILALPDGFEYVTFSKTGDPMSDGTPTPMSHDGTAAFPYSRGKTQLIRNHEVRSAPGTVPGSVQVPENRRYDPLGVGGTTSVIFDTRRGRVVRDWANFGGSFTNCAGGVAYRDAGWITCEETVAGPRQGWGRKHGYIFFVPTSAESPFPAPPVTDAGRFSHEAVAVDPRTGYVYETEDDGNDSGFYRFRPRDPRRLERGGSLEQLAVRGQDGYDTITGQTVGRRLPVRWVPIDDPDPDLEGGATPVPLQGAAGGAAAFNRLEGIWYDRSTGGFFFNSTSGGDAGWGQVWHYHPRHETLTLFFESEGGSVLDSPDNLLVTPRGGIVLAEDNASATGGGGHPTAPGIADVNRLIGLSRRGEAFELAVNTLSDSEFTGPTFSADGTTLFANIQGGSAPGSGMTVAITGPWHRGPL